MLYYLYSLHAYLMRKMILRFLFLFFYRNLKFALVMKPSLRGFFLCLILLQTKKLSPLSSLEVILDMCA